MQLVALRTKIVTEIKAILPQLKTCRTHPGRFDMADISKISTVTPAVLVSCLGVGAVIPVASGEWDFALRFAAYVLTKPALDLPADQAALNIAEALCLHVSGQHWGLDWVHPAARVRVENIGVLSGVVLLAVAWEQLVRIGTDVWQETGILPTHLYASQAPLIGAEHEAEYTELTDEQS